MEAMEQFRQAGDEPDILIGCVGGGSNFAGLSFPYLGEKLRGKRKGLRAIAVEPSSCPTLTKGVYAYDYGDTAGIGPIAKMYTLGHDFVPPSIHAGGLRYHGDSPILSRLVHEKVMEAVAVHQTEVFQAAVTFARTEGIIMAPETAHAAKVVIDEALKCRQTGEKKVILFNLSGHGNLDLGAYDDYFEGKLSDFEYPDSKIQESLATLPKVG
jgi:tryptophan synthase beta chain